MKQKTASDGGEVETHNLKVNADTIVNGLKINDKPGEKRVVLFPKQLDGRGEGVLRDVRGQHWDGDAPVQLQPSAFVPDELARDLKAMRVESREMARDEGENEDEWADEIMDVWESDVRSTLKDDIVVKARFPEETKTLYKIEYVDE